MDDKIITVLIVINIVTLLNNLWLVHDAKKWVVKLGRVISCVDKLHTEGEITDKGLREILDVMNPNK